MSELFTLSRFDRPWALLILGLAVLMWLMARRSLPGLGPVRGKLAAFMRLSVLALLVLALAGTHKILKNDDLNVMYLADFSKSVPLDLRRETENFIVESSRTMKENDKATLLTFDGRTNIEQLPSNKGASGTGIHRDPPFPDGQRPDQTNISQAIRMAIACMPPDMNNRMVIISDGNQNVGDAVTEARSAKTNKLPIDVVPLPIQHGDEVVFEQMKVPPYANKHEQITLRPILRSDRATTGEIRIYRRIGDRQEELIDLVPENERFGQRVQLNPGRNPFLLTLPIIEARSHEFRAEFIPDDPTADVIGENNVVRGFTNVEGPPTVLFLGQAEAESEDSYLVEALKREKIRVVWKAKESVTISTAALQDYSAVVLSNIAAENFSADEQRSLATYVRNLGGGLVMTGGDQGFGAGGWQGSPVEEVMPIRFDVDSVRQIPRGALAIVMHSCEMPNGNKWGVETAVAALKTLSRLDYFGVVGWGFNGFHWEVKMQQASDKDGLTRKIRNMQNADMFDFQTPMNMAYKALMATNASVRHMIIISDGDPSAPSAGLINRMRGAKITCSTVSIFPHGGNEIGTLKRIAADTGGTYWPLSKPGDEKQLPKIFIKEARIVRRPLLREEPFVPQLNFQSDVLTGIGGPFPQLRGYVVTTPRKAMGVEIPLRTNKGDPLLAHWQCETGRAVAFTSGWWEHWGQDWTEWPSYSKLWAQSVRWCMKQGTAANFDVRTVVEGDNVRMIIESMEDPAGKVVAGEEGGSGFGDFLQFDGRVIAPNGEAKPVRVTQIGPGQYEAVFKADQKGTWLITAGASGGPNEKPVQIRTGVTMAYSPEFRDLTSNEALLREVADVSGGRVLGMDDAGKAAIFQHNLPPTISREPIWDFLLKLAIFTFLLDVAVRRIALDPLQWLLTARARLASLAGGRGRGERSVETLRDLRGARDRVRQDRSTQAGPVGKSASGPSRGGPPAPPPSAKTKFDAGNVSKPTGDLASAMGADQAADKPKAPPPKKKVADDGPQESTTARLLKSKRRAREETDGNKDD